MKKKINAYEVVDDNGKRRFHGAFTGGFSAGYFNTVGSAEGWKPATFQSSRLNRALPKNQDVTDFLDNDDGLLGKTLAKKEDYNTFGTGVSSTSKSVTIDETMDTLFDDAPEDRKKSSNRSIPGPIPSEFRLSHNKSIGRKLLSQLGWKEGQGVGARIKMNKTEDINSYSNILHEGIDITNISNKAFHKGDITFAPKNISSATIIPPIKADNYGIGYNPETDKHNIQSSRNLKLHSNILEDDDNVYDEIESIQSIKSQIHTIQEVTLDEDEENNHHPYPSKSPKFLKDTLNLWTHDAIKSSHIQKCSDGKLPLSGFHLQTKTIKNSKDNTDDSFFVIEVPSEFEKSITKYVHQFLNKKAVPTSRATLSSFSSNDVTTFTTRNSRFVAGSTEGKITEDIVQQQQQQLDTKSGESSVFDLLNDKAKKQISNALKSAQKHSALPAADHIASLPPPATAPPTPAPVTAAAVSSASESRPYLSSSSTFFGLSQAFKNRFTSPSVAASMLEPSNAAKGGITLSKDIPKPVADTTPSLPPPVVAPLSQSLPVLPAKPTAPPVRPMIPPRREVLLWAPEPLLCKRFNVPVPASSASLPKHKSSMLGSAVSDVSRAFDQQVGQYIPLGLFHQLSESDSTRDSNTAPSQSDTPADQTYNTAAATTAAGGGDSIPIKVESLKSGSQSTSISNISVSETNLKESTPPVAPTVAVDDDTVKIANKPPISLFKSIFEASDDSESDSDNSSDSDSDSDGRDKNKIKTTVKYAISTNTESTTSTATKEKPMPTNSEIISETLNSDLFKSVTTFKKSSKKSPSDSTASASASTAQSINIKVEGKGRVIASHHQYVEKEGEGRTSNGDETVSATGTTASEFIGKVAYRKPDNIHELRMAKSNKKRRGGISVSTSSTRKDAARTTDVVHPDEGEGEEGGVDFLSMKGRISPEGAARTSDTLSPDTARHNTSLGSTQNSEKTSNPSSSNHSGNNMNDNNKTNVMSYASFTTILKQENNILSVPSVPLPPPLAQAATLPPHELSSLTTSTSTTSLLPSSQTATSSNAVTNKIYSNIPLTNSNSNSSSNSKTSASTQPQHHHDNNIPTITTNSKILQGGHSDHSIFTSTIQKISSSMKESNRHNKEDETSEDRGHSHKKSKKNKGESHKKSTKKDKSHKESKKKNKKRSRSNSSDSSSDSSNDTKKKKRKSGK